jgi:hypothetical protein
MRPVLLRAEQSEQHRPRDGRAVEAFWPVTMYEADGFHMANPPNRFSVHGIDALTYNPDGPLDLYIQHESPGAARVRSI